MTANAKKDPAPMTHCATIPLGKSRPCDGRSQTRKSHRVAIAYGRGIEMVTSYNVTSWFSSSYSMLTSQVPSFDGVGQQLTTENVI